MKDPVKRGKYDRETKDTASNPSTSYGKPFGWKKQWDTGQPEVLQDVENDITRIKSTVGFARRMWGDAGKLEEKLYSDLICSKLRECRDYLQRGKYPEARSYVEIIKHLGEESGLDIGWAVKVLDHLITAE